MKALVLAAALAALISATPAGAARDVKPEAISDAANATLVADAGNLGHGNLAALNEQRKQKSKDIEKTEGKQTKKRHNKLKKNDTKSIKPKT